MAPGDDLADRFGRFVADATGPVARFIEQSLTGPGRAAARAWTRHWMAHRLDRWTRVARPRTAARDGLEAPLRVL